MTGLSNQALSSALIKPLLTLFEARPTETVWHSGLSFNTRIGGTMPEVIAVRVMTAVTRSVKAFQKGGSFRRRDQGWKRSWLAA
jgi:hypothetical protein